MEDSTLFNRIRFVNTPTYGTMGDRNLQKATYRWIGMEVPEGIYFFCRFVCDDTGINLTVMVTIEACGKIWGPYNVLNSKTPEEILTPCGCWKDQGQNDSGLLLTDEGGYLLQDDNGGILI